MRSPTARCAAFMIRSMSYGFCDEANSAPRGRSLPYTSPNGAPRAGAARCFMEVTRALPVCRITIALDAPFSSKHPDGHHPQTRHDAAARRRRDVRPKRTSMQHG